MIMNDYLAKNKMQIVAIAITGTVFVHIAVMIFLNYGKIQRHYVPIGEFQQIPIVMDELTPEEEEKLEELKLQNDNSKVSNMTVNEADKEGQSDKQYESRNFSNLDETVEKELRDYEKNAFNEFAAKHNNTVEVNDPSLTKKNNDKKNENGNGNTDGSHTKPVGRVSGSYDLGGRRDEYFAKPAYVCKGSGTIVLNVKVNRNGKVTSAVIDKMKSSYTEECMGENAVRYCYKCKFEASTSYPDPQSGTVTYTYISQ